MAPFRTCLSLGNWSLLPVNRGPAGRQLSSSAAAHGSRQRKGRTAQGSWLMLGWELKMQGMVLFPSSLFLSFFTPRVFLVLLCLLLALPPGRISIWPSLYGGGLKPKPRSPPPFSQGAEAKYTTKPRLVCQTPAPHACVFSLAFLRLRLEASRFPGPTRGFVGHVLISLVISLTGLGLSDRDGWFGRGEDLAAVSCLCSCNLQWEIYITGGRHTHLLCRVCFAVNRLRHVATITASE